MFRIVRQSIDMRVVYSRAEVLWHEEVWFGIREMQTWKGFFLDGILMHEAVAYVQYEFS